MKAYKVQKILFSGFTYFVNFMIEIKVQNNQDNVKTKNNDGKGQDVELIGFRTNRAVSNYKKSGFNLSTLTKLV